MAALHIICGKAGADKTTLARRLAATLPAIVFVEDEWISTLGFEITSLTDFIAASQRCGHCMSSKQPMSNALPTTTAATRGGRRASTGFPLEPH